MTVQRDETDQEPGRGVAKAPSILGGIILVLLYYLLAGAAIFFLTLWIGFELITGFLGGRFRWACAVRKSFRAHIGLLRALARSLNLPKNVESSIQLTEGGAPELFSMLEPLCLRQGIHFPPEVFLKREAEALVRLTGYQGRTPKVELAIGFDLLAGTTRTELEAVLAHELSHATITPWAARHLLMRGMERAAQLSRGLSKLDVSRKKTARSPHLTRVILRVADGFGEALAQRISALSRQDEFKADSSAAEISGPETFRKTLLKVQPLARFSARISWRERMAQLQAHTFCAWLVTELEKVKPVAPEELAAQIHDRFSTHPSLRDRLNALPSGGEWEPASDDRPALELLVDPEAMAEKLIASILESSIKQEDADTRDLRRWVREMRTTTDLKPVQVLGSALVIAAEIAGAAAWMIGAEIEIVAPIFGLAILGVLFFWLGQYREQFSLPIPDFGLLKQSWGIEWTVPDDEIKNFKAALMARVANQSRSKTETHLARKCCETLAESDYPRAGVAAKMLLERNPGSPQGLLTSAICSAWRGQAGETARTLATVQKNIGLKGLALCWGMAWAFMLRGNWARAEALLEQVFDKHPSDPTLLNLRALCQARRGKIQSAIINARRACQPRPKNIEHAKFLIDLLLEGGYVSEARARLLPLEHTIAHDQDLMLAAIRLDLLSRDFEKADRQSQALLEKSPPPYMMVQLAAFHELAGQVDEAGQFYSQALAHAHYPDACLGLARVERHRNNIPTARQHAFDALNFRRPLGKFATPPLELLEPILTQLAVLESPVPTARAWVADVAANALPAALAGMSFVVFAASQSKAETHLLSIITAMSGGGLQVVATNISWRLAPPEHQPFGMVRPGVQPLWRGVESSPFRGFQRRGLWQPRHARIQSLVEGLRLLPEYALPA